MSEADGSNVKFLMAGPGLGLLTKVPTPILLQVLLGYLIILFRIQVYFLLLFFQIQQKAFD